MMFHFFVPLFSVLQTEIISQFDKLLTDMTMRLHNLSFGIESKDKEIHSLKVIATHLRKDSIKSEAFEYNEITQIGCEKLSKKKIQYNEHSNNNTGCINSPNSTVIISSENSPSHKLRSPIKALCKNRFRKSQSESPKRKLSLAPSTFSTSDKNSKLSVHHLNSSDDELYKKLKSELTEKERIETDMRLSSLSTADQIEVAKESINNLFIEIETLKEENVYLKRSVTHKDVS